MPGIKKCKEILGRHGVILSDDQLGHLMDILHYLAIRVCEQAEGDLESQKRQPHEKEEQKQNC